MRGWFISNYIFHFYYMKELVWSCDLFVARFHGRTKGFKNPRYVDKTIVLLCKEDGPVREREREMSRRCRQKKGMGT